MNLPLTGGYLFSPFVSIGFFGKRLSLSFRSIFSGFLGSRSSSGSTLGEVVQRSYFGVFRLNSALLFIYSSSILRLLMNSKLLAARLCLLLNTIALIGLVLISWSLLVMEYLGPRTEGLYPLLLLSKRDMFWGTFSRENSILLIEVGRRFGLPPKAPLALLVGTNCSFDRRLFFLGDSDSLYP